MAVLVDTCVISEVRHPNGQPSVKARFASLDPSDTYFSVITLGELTAGIERLPPGQRRYGLAAWLDGLAASFADRLLPVGPDVARLWGELTARRRSSGFQLPVSDGLIAATALHHRCSLMTRNEKDFDGTGVTIVNPWER